jgi:magnesium chelatase subunit D
MAATSHIEGHLAHGLACAALTPALRRVLLFDASHETFFAAARKTAAMLAAVTRHTPQVIVLGSGESEDDLWTILKLEQDGEGSRLVLKPGRLAPDAKRRGTSLVLIPDLTRISLSAARACVALMGDGPATLQRHGLSLTWSPDLCWLARCRRGEIGEASPHLLDRFVLRLSADDEPPADRAGDILKWLEEEEPHERLRPEPLPKALVDGLRAAAPHTPTFSDTQAVHVLSYIKDLPTQEGVRREVALGRLSRALAQLNGAHEVTMAHVDEAAALVGLWREAATPGPLSDIVTGDASEPVLPAAEIAPETSGVSVATPAAPHVASEGASGEAVLQPDTEMTLDAAAVEPSPYPEDETPPEREVTPLQLPVQRYRAASAVGGQVVGTQPARTMEDIAVMSTIMEAAKFQKLRARDDGESRGFRIGRSDLRCYRRAPSPEQMLMLVIDYTSLRGCRWEESVWPYLRWAYVARASVSVVQIGLAGREGGFQAKLVTARSLLSRQIREALGAQAGKATPLAHGLDVAARTLRTVLQHGRARAQKVRLVVLSDGRGNVQLSASRAGKPQSPISREGIDDALTVARELRTMNGVEIFFLNPQPQQYVELPVMLAEALGATVENVPLKETL